VNELLIRGRKAVRVVAHCVLLKVVMRGYLEEHPLVQGGCSC
jgi:hypothetical protein